MKFEFDLNEDDYINFNIANMSYSNIIKRNLLINKYLVPLLWIILTFVWGEISSIPALIWLIAFGIISIIWICFFNKYMEIKTKYQLKKELKSRNRNLVLGKRVVEINDDQLFNTGEYIQNTVDLKSTEKIVIEKDYVYVYITQISAIIIPLRIFKDVKEKDSFINYMYQINLS